MFNNDKSKKKKFYKKSIEVAKQKIWQKEFLLRQLREMREKIRREYDRKNETMDAQGQYRDLIKVCGLEKAKEINKLGPEQGKQYLKDNTNLAQLSDEASEIVKTLEKQLEEGKTDIEYFKGQMSGIDHQMEESHESKNDGGIVGVIGSLRETIKLLRDEIRRI